MTVWAGVSQLRRDISLKAAGLDWRKHALKESSTPLKIVEIAELLARFDTDIERPTHYLGIAVGRGSVVELDEERQRHA